MAYVITQPCIGVKDKGCMSVCPCDCIRDGTITKDGTTYDMLFIHPEECIDCGLCETECPVGAVFHEMDVPQQWQHFIPLNAEFFRANGGG